MPKAEVRFLPMVDAQDEAFALIEDLPPELDELTWKFNGNDLSLSDDFPEDVVFTMSKGGGKKLGDYVPNLDGMLIVSEKLKGVLERNSEDFEFHLVSIRNHKGRIEKTPYFLAQLLLSVPCLDLNQSEVRWSAMDTTQARRITRLVLDPDKLPRDRKIFRLGEMKSLILVRHDLGAEIWDKEECRGMMFQKPEHYGREFRSS